jgi:signal transduction histidine kinase
VWILVAVSAALTATATLWVRMYAMRSELNRQAQGQAEEAITEIKKSLEQFEPDSEERDYAIALSNYINRHPRIHRLELFVKKDSPSATSLRIVAPRGEATEITRLPSLPREPIVYTRKATEGEVYTIQRNIDLRGPWQADLLMHWSLQPVKSIIKVTERWSLILGAAHLIALVILTGFVIDRVILRRLNALAAAMRDVEGGDLDRRVPAGSSDEVGKLTQHFNQMLDQLSSANREIRAFNQRLAHEVEAATMDLSQKNSALEQLNRILNDLRQENASKVRLATLGQLAAQLAHEIGTPLSSVSGHLQLARLQRDLQPALRERLEVASREIARIGHIVRDYLDSTRSLEADRKPTHLQRLLEEAIDVTCGADPSRKRSVTMESMILPETFMTDPGLLRQIIINLLTNAFDATAAGGTVSVTARTLDNEIHIGVQDTGPGIAPEDLRRIFEPFYTTKGRGKGTGLGLAICRELSRTLGGAILVASEQGKGSTFTIRLPFAPPTEREATPSMITSGGVA